MGTEVSDLGEDPGVVEEIQVKVCILILFLRLLVIFSHRTILYKVVQLFQTFFQVCSTILNLFPCLFNYFRT